MKRIQYPDVFHEKNHQKYNFPVISYGGNEAHFTFKNRPRITCLKKACFMTKNTKNLTIQKMHWIFCRFWAEIRYFKPAAGSSVYELGSAYVIINEATDAIFHTKKRKLLKKSNDKRKGDSKCQFLLPEERDS